ncbi:MAG: ABC transporter ATP-binding protein [Pseudomonadota bacterium]
MALALARIPEVPVHEAGASAAQTGHGSLVVEDLHHRIGSHPILYDVGLAVGSGEVHALVGPSGCGKSTTLRLIAGLEPLQRGRIAICGRPVAAPSFAVPPERRRVGLMFQDYALFPHLSVSANVAFGLGSLPRAARQATAERWLARVELQGYGDRYPHQLSGGEQQRVALARALAPAPCLMLLDEAFSSLDAHLREDLRALVMALLRETGTPTLMVTHDADEAIRVADRMHVMHAGRVVQSGTPAEVYNQPNDLFVCGFFGAASRFKGWAVGGRVSTPLGDVLRPDLADGTAVDVVVRPEATRVAPGATGPSATVLGVRDLGPKRLVELAVGAGWVIGSHLSRTAAVTVGSEVALDVDRAHVFVFPAR